MKKLFSLLLLSCWAIISFSQDKIYKGTKVSILEIAKDDTYYEERADFLGKNATALGDLNKNTNGFYSGTLEIDGGRTCFFKNIKVAANTTSKTTTTSSSAKPIKFVTGTIAKGTSLYVAEISPDDSYYSDRFDKIGKKGEVAKTSMTMKDDGYYAGDFLYDDGTTAYFYKVKFSKEPVAKLEKTTDDNTDNDNWSDAENDDDVKSGDVVKITSVSPEDSYYDEKEDYIGEQGIAGDVDYDEDEDGYGGTVKLNNGSEPYFYLVKLKKVKSGSTTSSSTSASDLPKTISKNTKVVVTDIGKEDGFYSSKSTYTGKTGKVADGLTLQTEGYYSGKILFDDGTDAYFFNAKITVLK